MTRYVEYTGFVAHLDGSMERLTMREAAQVAAWAARKREEGATRIVVGASVMVPNDAVEVLGVLRRFKRVLARLRED